MLSLALKVASDSRADRGLRDEIFGVIETIGGPQAQAGLVHIIATDKEEMVRYHAFESALAVGKAVHLGKPFIEIRDDWLEQNSLGHPTDSHPIAGHAECPWQANRLAAPVPEQPRYPRLGHRPTRSIAYDVYHT